MYYLHSLLICINGFNVKTIYFILNLIFINIIHLTSHRQLKSFYKELSTNIFNIRCSK